MNAEIRKHLEAQVAEATAKAQALWTRVIETEEAAKPLNTIHQQVRAEWYQAHGRAERFQELLASMPAEPQLEETLQPAVDQASAV